jgi:hypothetical protein
VEYYSNLIFTQGNLQMMKPFRQGNLIAHTDVQSLRDFSHTNQEP